jgi:predicted nucleotidyltransferase
MKQNEITSYAYDFISQLLDNKKLFSAIKRIILFGSIARDDFREESDIDIFIEVGANVTKDVKEVVKKELNKFEERAQRSWNLRGIDSPIKPIVGNLKEKRWKNLKEEIMSYGKLAYARLQKAPEKMKPKLIITYDISKLDQKDKMSFLRKLYGYTTRTEEKEYSQKGIIDEIESEKLGTNTLIINTEDLELIKPVLRKNRVKYRLKQIWSE